ncbi:MAG: AAA family ATPase [Gammaproteobacteria bacterium]|nr:AAA family ATPase [Gammaproteobacteria bacterium]
MAENSRERAGSGSSDQGASEALVRGLLEPDAYPHETDAIELVETHISWVLLTGPYAYKVKKPLALPFLDFSTLERRRHFCDEELRLNRRLAPQLYLDVVPIGGRPGSPRVGEEPAIEYAVKLRQFPPDATADRRLEAGAVSAEDIRRLAERIARFHAELPPAEAPPVVRHAIDNLEELEQALERAGRPRSVARLREWTQAQCEALRDVLDERARGGAIREGHGDLHLENVVEVEGELLPFDALEFDRGMRCVDVVDEAAFLIMDLRAHGRPDLAARFLNRYFEITGDYPGARLLTFYVVYRALVRAKVRALKASQPHAVRSLGESVDPYLRLAESSTERRTPLLLITHGLSGSGKTTVTERLLAELPAVRIRSDLERKRLHGVDAAEHGNLAVGAGRYDRASSDRTYETLARFAADALAGGLDTIVDAAFLTRSRRSDFRALAGRCGAAFVILDCAAAEDTLRARIRARAAARSDASEATEAVLDAQLRSAEPIGADERPVALRVDTSGEIDYGSLCEALLARRSSSTNAAR